jgi:hypothetical protein
MTMIPLLLEESSIGFSPAKVAGKFGGCGEDAQVGLCRLFVMAEMLARAYLMKGRMDDMVVDKMIRVAGSRREFNVEVMEGLRGHFEMERTQCRWTRESVVHSGIKAGARSLCGEGINEDHD